MSRYLRTRVWSLIRKLFWCERLEGKRLHFLGGFLFGTLSYLIVNFGSWSLILVAGHWGVEKRGLLLDQLLFQSLMTGLLLISVCLTWLQISVKCSTCLLKKTWKFDDCPHFPQLSTLPIFSLVTYLFFAFFCIAAINRHSKHPFPPGRLYRCMAAVR